MVETNSTDINTRMYTFHGRKKYQGKWMLVNNKPALTFTEGQEGAETVVGYTTIDEMIQMAYKPGLPEAKI